LKSLNLADIAHNIADNPGGSRGDKEKSGKLANDIFNLLLLCKECHKEIDDDPISYTVEKLHEIKSSHERDIEFLTSFVNSRKSHIITYVCNISYQRNPVDLEQAANALFKNGYRPATTNGIDLSLSGSAITDRDEKFWQNEKTNLVSTFNRDIRDRITKTGDIKHVSLFALAPIPLLIKLGTLFTDKIPVEVYQKHREPDTWEWLNVQKIEYKLEKLRNTGSNIALILSLSGQISCDDVKRILGDDVSIWEINIDNPNNDFIKSKQHVDGFRLIIRKAFNEIKKCHGADEPISVFPAIPISAAIEVGRVWMPKADLPLIIYDRNRDANLKFMKALTIGGET
jgi:hypothetical protein